MSYDQLFAAAEQFEKLLSKEREPKAKVRNRDSNDICSLSKMFLKLVKAENRHNYDPACLCHDCVETEHRIKNKNKEEDLKHKKHNKKKREDYNLTEEATPGGPIRGLY